MTFVAWKFVKNEDYIIYRMQVNWESGESTKKKIMELMKEWILSGEGIGKKSCLIFNKKFDNIQQWRKWVKSFPHKVEVKR